MFSDAYLDKEDNARIFQVFVDWLTSDRVQLNSIDANEPEVSIPEDANAIRSVFSFAKEMQAYDC
jgi:hypothetical protein